MWCYTLDLTKPTDAAIIEQDWVDDFGAAIADRGVSQAGSVAVVTTTPREPNYTSFESREYVNVVEETIELPDPLSDDWNPPYDATKTGDIIFLK